MLGIKKLKSEIKDLKDKLSSFDTISRTDADRNKVEFDDKFNKRIESAEQEFLLNVKNLDAKADIAIKANKDISNIHLKRIEDGIKVAFTNLEEKMSVGLDKKLLEFHRDIDKKYMEAIERVFSLNRDLSLMSTFNGKNDAKADLTQPLLEMKWAKDKNDKGDKIVSSGVKVFEKRKSLHDEILQIEKSGGDVSKLKEQLKSFDWILEVINEKKD